MTDRIRTLTVVLNDDYRDDEVEEISMCIERLKGVAEVRFGAPVNLQELSARAAVRIELQQKMIEMLQK